MNEEQRALYIFLLLVGREDEAADSGQLARDPEVATNEKKASSACDGGSCYFCRDYLVGCQRS